MDTPQQSTDWAVARSSGRRLLLVDSAQWPVPVRCAGRVLLRLDEAGILASGHLQCTAVDGNLRAAQLDAATHAVVNLDASGENLDLLSASGFQRDAAD